ncbi:hypothetical protein LTR85_001510 [Meristemomyces frigidus]|nr:hypothetical protein LTR85_001510 [Meristemomyces frigidus]
MSSSSGTKVTKDPETFNNPKNENPGVVTSDSLAGESITSGGSFGANSDSRGPMAQPSSSTNTNNADVSGATKLDAAPSADAREAQEGWSESAQLNAGRELGSGAGPTYSDQATGGSLGSTSGGGSGSSSTGGGSGSGSENTDPSSSSTSSGGSGTAAAAPGYTSHPAPSMGDSFAPKGQNLQEGGFSSDDPNASFTTDIGGENDPGRAALQGMQARDASAAGGAGPREGKISGDGQYDTLDEAAA